MFETRLEAALWVGIAAMGLGMLASMPRAEESQEPVVLNANPPAEPSRGPERDPEMLLPSAAEEAAAPPSGIPCSAGEPAGRIIDPGAEAAPVHDPYAG